MTRLAPVLATAAGAMTFVVTTAAVGSILFVLVEGAIVLTVPIALGTGTAAMTVVYVGLADDSESEHYRFALSMGGMGMTFLAVFLGGVAAGFPLGDAFAAGAGAGMVAAVGIYIARGQ